MGRTATFLGSPAALAAQQHPSPLPPHSAWRSPVPYLFGGLAAMLGLIAFALLLLACSYWKLSGYLEGDSNGAEDGANAESGGGKPEDDGVAKAPPRPPEQRIVVIMAGDEKPTFLATPASSQASSFNDRTSGSGKPGDVEEGKMGDGSTTETATGGGDSGAADDGGRHHEGTLEEQGAGENHDGLPNGEASHQDTEGDQ